MTPVVEDAIEELEVLEVMPLEDEVAVGRVEEVEVIIAAAEEEDEDEATVDGDEEGELELEVIIAAAEEEDGGDTGLLIIILDGVDIALELTVLDIELDTDVLDICMVLELAPSQIPNIGSHIPGEQYCSSLPQYPLVLQHAPNMPPVQVWLPEFTPHSPIEVTGWLPCSVHEPKSGWQPPRQ